MSCYPVGMADVDPLVLTTAERALIRLAFMVRFGQEPRLADGIWLRTWQGGPLAGQPKVPPAVASLLARGLVVLGPDRIGARARFTPDGYAALRRLAEDRRALDRAEYAHVLRELEGMQTGSTAAA